MALLASAESAQDIASVFNKFLDPVAEHSAEITGLISVCFALSSALRELAEAISDPRLQARQINIKEDLQTLLRSLDYTFKDVNRLFGGLGRTTAISPSAGYRQVWREVESHFQEESNNTLSVRLKFYRMFLDDMISIIYEGCRRPHFSLSQGQRSNPAPDILQTTSSMTTSTTVSRRCWMNRNTGWTLIWVTSQLGL